MRSCTSFRNLLGSKVGIYIDLYAIMNHYCVIRARNDFYLPATLKTLNLIVFISRNEISYHEPQELYFYFQSCITHDILCCLNEGPRTAY